MLGIIGAMDVEVDTLKSKVTGKTSTTVAGIEFVCGFIEEVMVCVAQCSPGKVNASLCTQIMIDCFDADKIINVGVGCSLSDDVVIKNIVIATDVCQYDIDITALGEPKGFINGLNVIKIKTDSKLCERLAQCAINSGEKIHLGTIASGDTFIADSKLKKDIQQEFNAICGEMEGGAIGHTCAANNIPFAVIRCISDGGDESSQLDYPTFKKIAADISTAIIINFIKTEQEQLSLYR
ncbi:MAG: 5'-methylthioadenosine/adenosylhomocysteine nucleosidase [Acetobacter sp.]|nr:5'-methylthioadenosine/adenosylhomocysteine nucleosidase [Bacteroides sp.]MCM1340383.1 5'-methylthioadenosine/adenosylhomocysteine nucleosidase [Acetobacter sp.]MCM1432970.1 5'-methylthioadenosine/adenosylhomocysteine nucleosidase [Clostridiales bacterium]